MEHPAALAPPDGGYGWVIVLAVVLQLLFCGPIMPMFGILFGPKFTEFGATTSQQTSIFALYLVSWNLSTLFVGPLIQLRSERFVAFCSTTMVVGGLVLCSYSTSTYDLMLAYGLAVGCGMGLGNANGIIILNKYFKKRVGTAFGLMATGLAVSSQVLPQLVKVLVTNLTSRQTLLVYACLCSTGYIGAILMRDVRPLLVPLQGEELEEHRSKLLAKPPLPKPGQHKGVCANFVMLRALRMIDWRLLKEPYFVMIALGNLLVFVCMLSYVPMLKNIFEERGLDLSQSANVLTALGITEMLGRPATGSLGDLSFLRRVTKTPKKLLFIIYGLGCAGGFLAQTLTSGIVSVAIVTCLTGLFGAGAMVTSSLVLGEAFERNFPSALGLSNLFRALLAIIISPIFGMLKETTGSFTIPLVFLASCMIVSMVVWILAAWLWKREPRVKQNGESDVGKVCGPDSEI